MPHDVAITEKHDPGLYDVDTREILRAERVVDITDCVADGERTLLLYTRAKRGRIVQITTPFDGHEYMGAHIHFFVDEDDEPIRQRARRHRMEPGELVRIIREFA